MLKPFQTRLDGYLETLNTANHHIELISPYIRPIQSSPYRAGPKAREREKVEIDWLLKEEIIGPAQSYWACPIVFVPGMNGEIRFCVDYHMVKPLHCERFLYPVKNGWIYTLIQRSSIIFDTAFYQWVLADLRWEKRHREYSFYLSLWLISVYKNFIWFEERTTYAPTCDGRNIISG